MLAPNTPVALSRPYASPHRPKPGSSNTSFSAYGTLWPARNNLFLTITPTSKAFSMSRLSQRWEIPNRPGGIYYQPQSLRLCANSTFWYCFFCGNRYAEVRSWVDDVPQPWQARGGCCLSCSGNRWTIPGSLESLSLIGWGDVPEEVLRYQFKQELSFTHSPQHPMNQKEYA